MSLLLHIDDSDCITDRPIANVFLMSLEQLTSLVKIEPRYTNDSTSSKSFPLRLIFVGLFISLVPDTITFVLSELISSPAKVLVFNLQTDNVLYKEMQHFCILLFIIIYIIIFCLTQGNPQRVKLTSRHLKFDTATPTADSRHKIGCYHSKSWITVYLIFMIS